MIKLASVMFLACMSLGLCAAEPLKQHSAFYHQSTLARIRKNLQALPNAAEAKKAVVDRASYWTRLSDDDLWALMFGPAISRSWMVWSDGHCPSCTNAVQMYRWKMAPQTKPWKTQCPECGEFFPKNDFGAFHRSGLNKQGVFVPALADRKLLFNTEHPSERDPLRNYGVDDGEGFVRGDKRWRFIGAYLVYGQFKGLVLEGIRALSEAWVLTGEPVYAHKAAILLDRVADLYPEFDYAKQGLVYETRKHNGYISVWHDTCEETREMVLAYDRVFEAAREDPELVRFLSRKAAEHGLTNLKRSFAAIQQNIETRLLRDALNSPAKMHSNFPRREIAYTTIQAVLGWPGNRQQVENYMDEFIKRATAVDGVTGEKGLSGYSSYTISGLANLLAEFSRADPQFLPKMIERNPGLRQTWRFHIDTMCLDSFYPNSGDCGQFAAPASGYVGAIFDRSAAPRLQPSMYTFFWQLYEATGDPAYVQVLYKENGDTINGLPHDLFAENPESIRAGTIKVIKEHGSRPRLGSVHKAGWHLGVLRSGSGKNARALCLDYDSGGAHGHLDGMTLGLFAREADLLPDFGYVPVQHGGWSTPQVAWYISPFAHNTVAVDGNKQQPVGGKCTLWADGRSFRAIRAEAPSIVNSQEFTRTAVLIDVSDEEFYVVDLFRVRGGADHTKFVHGPYAEFSITGVSLLPCDPYGHGALMRNFRRDTNSQAGWTAQWRLTNGVSGQRQSTMRYMDFTRSATAHIAEANIMPFKDPNPAGFWNPALMIRHTGVAPNETTFASTLEAYGEKPVVRSARRLVVRHDGIECTNDCVALALEVSGGTDVFIASAPTHSEGRTSVETGGVGAAVPSTTISLTGQMAWVRHSADGRPTKAALCRTEALKAGGLELTSKSNADLIEIEFERGRVKIVSGRGESVLQANLNGHALSLE